MSQALSDGRQREMALAHPICVCTQNSAAIPLLPSLLPNRKENPQAAFLKVWETQGRKALEFLCIFKKIKTKKSQHKKKKSLFFVPQGRMVLLLLPAIPPASDLKKHKSRQVLQTL